LDSAIPLDVQQLATQSLTCHHDFVCGGLWPCRVSETSLHLNVWGLDEIVIAMVEQVLSQPLGIHVIEGLYVGITKDLAAHAATNTGFLTALLI
jgi:hypothetical protein